MDDPSLTHKSLECSVTPSTPGDAWQEDKDVHCCPKCSVSFTLINRRHHCVGCGKIFCGNCLTYQFEADPNRPLLPHQPVPGYFNRLKSWMWGSRFCFTCYDKQGPKAITNILVTHVPCLRLIKRIMVLSRKFRDAAAVHFANFRQIQYYLSNATFTPDQQQFNRRLLTYNRHFFAGHSRLLLQLAKHVDWNDAQLAEEVLGIMKQQVDRSSEPVVSKRAQSCFVLGCTKRCATIFHDAEALELLGCDNLHKEVYAYCLNALNRTPNQTLKCYLPTLVQYLQPSFPGTVQIFKFITNRSTQDFKLCTEVFYLLQVWGSSPTLAVQNHFQDLKTQFLFKLHKKQPSWGALLRKSQLLDEQLNNKTIEQLRESQDIQKSSFPLPCNPEIKVCGLDFDKCKAMPSKTKPLWLQFWTDEAEPKPKLIIYKQEDLRNDQVVLNIIELVDQILKIELKDDATGETGDLGFVKFNVIPTSSGGGFIEVATNAFTLADVIKKDQTINSYLMHSPDYPNRCVSDITTVFLRSFVVLCLLNYFLGFGDRHLDNIMIKSDARIFHIDFGYIMGQDPRPLRPEMRITSQMVDVIGGVNSQAYETALKLMKKCFHIIRRHANLFAVLLSNLYSVDPKIEGATFSKEQFHAYIANYFLPGYSDEEASKTFDERYASSKNAKTPGYVDLFRSFTYK